MSAGPADKTLDVFKDLIFDAQVKVVIAYITGLAPFLAFGPLAFIIARVVTYVADVLYAQLREVVNFQLILLNNAENHREYADAQIELSRIAKIKGIDSIEFRVLREKHKKALAKFVRYSGS